MHLKQFKMAAELFQTNVGSGTTRISISGTQFSTLASGTAIAMVLLMAMSGLAVIPVRCDSAGRIGSMT